ncbi:TBC1 domain family member 12 [Melanotaenia boesemani]|uniref:TBC1 domain family member 12 n=1 Tax=Melanotaenia boesemani TaxID=1250792 RepID=UPI001C04C906|nr:TBC1 domain family member 12 [Melanotaenia boesemani]
MDTTTENGGSFAVDLNDNEEESGVGEVAGKAGHRSALKGRSLALLAGVSGDQEAEKARTSVTSNGGGVNTAAPVQPPPHSTDIILDLEGCLSGRLADSCVVSGVCGDLNGFTESGGQEGGGEGLPLTGTTAASCPAGLRELVSAEEDGQRQEDPEGETRDCGSCIRTHLPPDRLPCTAAGDVNMPNGGVDSPAHSSPDGDTTYWKQTQVQDQRLSLSDVDCEQVKLANGGLHVVKSETLPDDLSFHWGAAEEKRPGWGHCLGSGPPGSLCPGQDAPAAARRPHLPAPGSSANLPHSCPSTQSDSLPQSEPITGEDEEDFSDLCFPVRPHSLRTNPNHAMSLSCDATPLSADEDGGYYLEDGGYEEDLRNVLEAGRRQSAPDKLPDLTGSDGKMLPKRFGLADFFTRSLFSRKSKEPKAASHNASGWRLFGKTAATEDEETSTNTQEEEVDLSSCPQRPLVAARRKNLEFEPLSTTALILEDRPSNLPAKSMEETQRHKLEYEEMVAGAKKREMKDAQKKKRQMKERHRHEDSISSAMVIWNTEILPHWDTVKGTRRVRELWWQGLPPSVRGRVWSLAIGNELNITPELYEIFLSRAKEKWRSYSETSSVNDSESDGGASLADRESSLDLIKLDISRTFPSLFIFQKGGPYHDLLHSVLGAYTCYRPDIGYVQGMSFIAAVLILNLEEAEAFITFANLLNKPCQMAFFRVDHELMLKYFSAFEIFFEENLPRLFCHFQSNSLTPDLYLIDWIFTLYSKSLPLDVACRVWDVFCRDGEESLFRTGLGILRLYEDILLQMDFIHIAQFLSRLPEDLQSQTLFNAMATTHMISRTRRWAQVFSALMKDGNKEVEKNSSPALRS